MIAYYNENDPYAAQWLRNLISAGHIADGEVDERSISDVQAIDLAGFDECHFFAGIGGWAYALKLAEWCGAVWTGSCPCQPFSSAGKQLGTADLRHLWPEFHRLIAECGPPIVFGEQVASKAGRTWLSGVRADLEALGYAVGAADLCAAGVGAPHIRQRLFWVADSQSERKRRISGELAAPERNGVRKISWQGTGIAESGNRGAISGLDDAKRHGFGSRWTDHRGDERQQSSPTGAGFWSRAEWLFCLDGKARRVESGIFPLVDGVPARVGKLRGAGNAIVPQVAASFIAAFMECAA